jgi:glycosyltransferase involved in cell wall biosynthesis
MILSAGIDPKRLSSFGGTPYYLYKYGHRAGLFSGCADIREASLGRTFSRLQWAIAEATRLNPVRGFQYSSKSIDHCWKFELQNPRLEYLNLAQLYPNEIVLDDSIKKWSYIDQTLLQMFSYYFQSNFLPRQVIDEIIERERKQYNRAQGIIVTSDWAALSLLKNYGISQSKISIIPRGANIDFESVQFLENYFRQPSQDITETNPLRLVFVGKDWKRKGLLRLISASKIAERMGAVIELTIVGVEKKELSHDIEIPNYTKWTGFLSKDVDKLAYTRLLLSNDVGCLLSSVEAGGISLREFHAHGLATLSPDVGGASDFAFSPSTISIPPLMPVDEVGQIIFALYSDREQLRSMKFASRQNWRQFLWSSAVIKIQNSIDSSREYQG